ncbi:MAG: bacteriophage Gp15 family protein [Ruminococcus sp.]|nr:bacteriophage Gp15 family protein [Ruminococcus sp.]
MINLLYEQYPTELIIDNVSYPIVTDFRNWIAFFDMINDDILEPKDKVLASLGWFKDKIPDDLEKAYNGLISFARADDLNPKLNKISVENKNTKQILSYLHDSPYILGAFLQVYHINLNIVDYMHWYKFRALLDALPEDVPLKKRMGYRAINISSIKDKAERKRIKAIQRDIALPSRELSAFDIGNQF